MLEDSLEGLTVVRAVGGDGVALRRLPLTAVLTAAFARPLTLASLRAGLPIAGSALRALARLAAGPCAGGVTTRLALAPRARLVTGFRTALLRASRLLAGIRPALAAGAVLPIAGTILRARLRLPTRLIARPPLLARLRLAAVGVATLVARLRFALPTVSLVGL
jgi:hypothetical protein